MNKSEERDRGWEGGQGALIYWRGVCVCVCLCVCSGDGDGGGVFRDLIY